MARISLVVFVTLVTLAALAVQLFSDGLYGNLAAAHSLPHVLAGDWPFDLAPALGLDRSAHVRRALARGALARSEPQRALTVLAPLPATREVDDLRGQAALGLGDTAQALRDFAAAGDFIAARSALTTLERSDPRAALALVRNFERQLAERSADPEISAEVDWTEGGFAVDAMERYPRAAASYNEEALAAYKRALDRAPNDEKYLLNYAFTALRLGDPVTAKDAYVRAADAVPNSVDAFVGVAVAAAALGDCTGAHAALATARTFAIEQGRVVDPVHGGYVPAVHAALVRCSM